MKTQLMKNLRARLRKADWKFLVFLILILNVKLVVKLAAIILIFLAKPKFKDIFRYREGHYPLFYLLMLVLSIFQLIIIPHPGNYLLVFITAILFWILPFLIMIQAGSFIKENDSEAIYKTIAFFFIINIVFSFADLLVIIIETGAINPYTYQGLNQKYFISTGDYIKGVSFNTSTTNAVINAFGLIYFLYKKNIWLSVLCLICLLLCGSNLVNLITVGVLFIIFIFWAGRNQKAMIVGYIAIAFCFVARITPQNSEYILKSFEKITGKKESNEIKVGYARLEDTPDSLLNNEDKKIKSVKLMLDSLAVAKRKSGDENIAAKDVVVNQRGRAINLDSVVMGPDINSASFQKKNSITADQKKLSAKAVAIYQDSALLRQENQFEKAPGKLLSYKQTLLFLQSGTTNFLLGAGPGNFSSKLAFRASGLNGSEGGWPQKAVYINENFKKNHLADYLYYFTKDAEKHSVTNLPNSVYNQLFGEYGIAGVALFLVFYVFYFIRRHKQLSYGLPMLLLLLAVFNIDYWFEQLSIVILFELLMFADMKISVKEPEHE